MEINRAKNHFDSYDYELKENEKTLTIIFARNLDLYFLINDERVNFNN